MSEGGCNDAYMIDSPAISTSFRALTGNYVSLLASNIRHCNDALFLLHLTINNECVAECQKRVIVIVSIPLLIITISISMKDHYTDKHYLSVMFVIKSAKITSLW